MKIASHFIDIIRLQKYGKKNCSSRPSGINSI